MLKQQMKRNTSHPDLENTRLRNRLEKLSVNSKGFATNYMTQSAHSKTLQVLHGFKLSVAYPSLISHFVPHDVSYSRKQMHCTFQTAKSESRTWTTRMRKIHVGCKKK